jgi:glycosyltransferase involved in cell wall biosynthesis
MDSEATPASPLVSVVLPCYNEAGCVADCVTEALEAMAAKGIAGEVVVVDNNSTDGSGELAAGAGARVVHESVPGYGSALRTGFLAADGEIIVMADADMTYDLSRIDEIIAPVLAGEADIVNGSRFDGANRRTMPFLHRWVGTPTLTLLTSRATGGLSLRDGQSGYRAFRRDKMLALGLATTGMEFNSEMVVKSARAGFRIIEIPMGYRERVGESKLSTFSDGWRHLKLISSLAPDLVLVWPGAVLFALGALLTVATLISPSGFDLGSLHWQPIFFSSICLVAGSQAMLAGFALAAGSSSVSPDVQGRYQFVTTPRFQRRCVAAGLLAILGGLGINLALWVNWVGDNPAPRHGAALAALAQSAILVGMTVFAFGLIAQLIGSRPGSGPLVADQPRGATATSTNAAAPDGVTPSEEAAPPGAVADPR